MWHQLSAKSMHYQTVSWEKCILMQTMKPFWCLVLQWRSIFSYLGCKGSQKIIYQHNEAIWKKNFARFLPFVKIRKVFQIWVLKISGYSYNWDINVILPLFCDISGIDAHKIIGTSFSSVVGEIYGGCETFFSRCMLFFYKTLEVFQIKTCGPLFETPKM